MRSREVLENELDDKGKMSWLVQEQILEVLLDIRELLKEVD